MEILEIVELLNKMLYAIHVHVLYIKNHGPMLLKKDMSKKWPQKKPGILPMKHISLI